MGIAIIITTLIVRTALVPLMRRQMVSMRRMQADRARRSRRSSGDSRATGSRPSRRRWPCTRSAASARPAASSALLPILLILPMYQVVREGLQAADLAESLKVFGFQVVPLTCPPPHLVDARRRHAALRAVHRLGDPVAGRPARERLRGPHPAAVHAPADRRRDLHLRPLLHGLQLVASRMALPPHDPDVAARPAGPDPAHAVALAAADHRPVRQRRSRWACSST